MDETPDNEPMNPTRPAWRFTLREILIAMVAVGAVLALVAKSRPFAPTSFHQAFMPKNTLGRVCNQLGEKLVARRSGNGQSRTSGSATQRYRVTIESPPASKSAEVVAALYDDIQEQLLKNGCMLSGTGKSGNTTFTIYYVVVLFLLIAGCGKHRVGGIRDRSASFDSGEVVVPGLDSVSVAHVTLLPIVHQNGEYSRDVLRITLHRLRENNKTVGSWWD